MLWNCVIRDILCFINSEFHSIWEDTAKHNNKDILLTWHNSYLWTLGNIHVALGKGKICEC